jgi:hypothetical protein
MNMKKLLYCALACLLLLAGCDGATISNEGTNTEPAFEEAPVYDESQFFIKTVEYQEADEHYICYRHPDGTVTEIVEMGIQENPFYIVGERIYYTQGDTLYSVDFTGGDVKTLFDGSEENISFNTIDRVDGEWLYCSGTKTKYIYGDPVALDGPHRVPIKTKVKTDFSEFSEIE